MTNPYSIVKIGDSAFHDCVSLKSIDIPDSVTEIGKQAFYGCGSLEAITLPKKVRVIEEGTFYDCASLKSVNIPCGVTDIGNGAFEFCTSLTEVTIPDSVTKIYSDSFANCFPLRFITVNGEKYDVNGFDYRDILLNEGSVRYNDVIVMYGYYLGELIRAHAEGRAPAERFWYKRNSTYFSFSSPEELKANLLGTTL